MNRFKKLSILLGSLFATSVIFSLSISTVTAQDLQKLREQAQRTISTTTIKVQTPNTSSVPTRIKGLEVSPSNVPRPVPQASTGKDLQKQRQEAQRTISTTRVKVQAPSTSSAPTRIRGLELSGGTSKPAGTSGGVPPTLENRPTTVAPQRGRISQQFRSPEEAMYFIRSGGYLPPVRGMGDAPYQGKADTERSAVPRQIENRPTTVAPQRGRISQQFRSPEEAMYFLRSGGYLPPVRGMGDAPYQGKADTERGAAPQQIQNQPRGTTQGLVTPYTPKK